MMASSRSAASEPNHQHLSTATKNKGPKDQTRQENRKWTISRQTFSALRPTKCMGDEAVLLRRFTGGSKRKDIWATSWNQTNGAGESSRVEKIRKAKEVREQTKELKDLPGAWKSIGSHWHAEGHRMRFWLRGKGGIIIICHDHDHDYHCTSWFLRWILAPKGHQQFLGKNLSCT